MKNIKKIISAASIISVMLTGSLGINALWERPSLAFPARDESLLKYIHGNYMFAYYKDHNFSFEQLAINSSTSKELRIILAEPIIFVNPAEKDSLWDASFDDTFKPYSYDNIYNNEIISGYFPTPEDFPEFEGIETVYIEEGENIDGHFRADTVSIVFYEYDYFLEAFYKMLDINYYNPVIGNAYYTSSYRNGRYYSFKFACACNRSGDGVVVPEPIYGDVNCDGKVTVNDLILEAKYISGKLQDFGTLVGEYQADYNEDGIINSEDLLLIIKKLIGEIS